MLVRRTDQAVKKTYVSIQFSLLPSFAVLFFRVIRFAIIKRDSIYLASYKMFMGSDTQAPCGDVCKCVLQLYEWGY